MRGSDGQSQKTYLKALTCSGLALDQADGRGGGRGCSTARAEQGSGEWPGQGRAIGPGQGKAMGRRQGRA